MDAGDKRNYIADEMIVVEEYFNLTWNSLNKFLDWIEKIDGSENDPEKYFKQWMQEQDK